MHVKNKKKSLYTSVTKTGATLAMMMMLAHPIMVTNVNATESVPEKLDINIQATCTDIEGIAADKKKITAFPHKIHAEQYLKGKAAYSANPYTDEFTCAACHVGTQVDSDIIGTDKCDRLTTAITTAGGGKGYKKQMHGICITCHKAMKKAKETTGPTSCKACHS